MKKILILLFLASSILASCTMFGLEVQKDAKHPAPDTLDAHLYKDTWDYIKSRSIQNPKDTLFKPFYTGIIYSGIDTNEYKKPNRTFILLNNEGVYKKNSAASYFNNIKGINGKTGTNTWANYKKDDVKKYLQYLIIEGQFSHDNIPTSRIDVMTTCPANSYVENPNSVLNFRVYNGEFPGANQSDSPVIINEQVATASFVITSDLRPTNGIIHVVKTFVNPRVAVTQ
jgi:hypothetical protein